MQDAKQGKLTRTWAAAAREADRAGAPMVRVSAAGKPFLVLMVDPATINAVLKKPLYVPKWVEGYKFFHWLVRCRTAATHRLALHTHTNVAEPGDRTSCVCQVQAQQGRAQQAHQASTACAPSAWRVCSCMHCAGNASCSCCTTHRTAGLEGKQPD